MLPPEPSTRVISKKSCGNFPDRGGFKVNVNNAESLASEMAAFANANGGTILIGVADDGSTPGLSAKDVSRINQLISNAASHLVRSLLTVQTENLTLENGRLVISLRVPKGIDKRRVNSKEELRRLSQMSGQFHADELPTKAGVVKLDKLRFRDFLRDVYKQPFPESGADLVRLLQNMNLATEDFAGPLRKIFDDSMAFVMRNLHKTQGGRGVNAPGQPEIPESVFEELLVNALVHRDYLVSAPIRLFVFDNRIEIISPGHLPNNLTVDKIRTGNSNIRNPILASYVAKGMLPFHGLGSGIKRALEAWPQIDFQDDHDGCLFSATIRRRPLGELVLAKSSPESSPESSPKTEDKILALIRRDLSMTTQQLGDALGISKRAVLKQIDKLKKEGRLQRIGPTKGGRWEVMK